MAKYTMTLEEYCQSRHYAKLLEDHIDAGTLPDDPRTLWMEACKDIEEDPSIAYDIITDEIMPDPDAVSYYTTDAGEIASFIAAFTDKFYFDEIGQETMGKFKITLRAFFRANMPYFADLYKSRLSALSDLASNYKRTTHDALEKSGSEQDQMQHGLTTDFEPGATQTNKIIPLGGSSETELNQSLAGGKDTTTNRGTDTNTLSFVNRVDSRWIVEELTGATGKDRAELIKAYRELIIDIDSMIFDAMRQYGLFIQVW